LKEQELEKLKIQYPEYNGKIANNAIDLTGKQYGNLLILYRTLNREDVTKNRRPQWVCKCLCENQTILIKSGIDIRNGKVVSCGCKKGHRTIEVPAGTIFGQWEVIKRVPNRTNDRVYYLCKCLCCNKTEKEVSYKNLKSGQSTKCLSCGAKAAGLKNSKDECGKVYGFLKVVKRATEEEKPRTDRTGAYWNCECLKCGRKNVIVFGDYLRNGNTKSCGCLNSFNESKICSILDKNNIQYKQQIYFSDFPYRQTLFFDIGIYNKDKLLYLIEYDGIQHFHQGHFSNDFDTTHKNDIVKNKYCFEHNIPLIRIPYNKEYEEKDLFLTTTKFLLTPENESLYYQNK